MSNISKPVDWDILNTPSIQPVQYYSLLKKKRELSQLIKQYDAQVFKHGYVHYCCIVPKNISACLNNKYEIYILFLSENSNTSFIGFRVKASKETFVHESNLLLLFLKKSKKTIFYLMNNNYIHVQCGIKDAWELFYLLYGEYLKRYVLTIIGTQFFFSFAFSYCMQKERQLLEMLYKGSKIVKVSRKSVYYKLHQKRKISVTDLVHMTYNMPKTKKHAVSCYNFKKPPILYRNIKNKFSATSQSTTNRSITSKTQKPFHGFSRCGVHKSALFKEIPVPFYPALSNSIETLISKNESHEQIISHHTSLKRKFQEVECSERKLPTTSTFNLFKSSENSLVTVDEWEKYAVVKPHSIDCYSDIPCLKNLVPKLLNYEYKDFPHKNNYEYKNQSNTWIKNEIVPLVSSIEDGGKNRGDMPTTKMGENYEVNEFATNSKIHKSKVYAVESFLAEPSQTNIKLNIHMTDNVTESCNQDNLNNSNDICFTTGTGKTISVSNNAMLAAQKLMKDTLCETSDPVCRNKELKRTNSFDDVDLELKKRAIDEEMSSNKNSGVHQFSKMRYLESKKSLGKPDSLFPYNIENVSQDYADSLGDVGFTTATGKDIVVSDSALQAAQKIIQGVLSEDSEQTSVKLPKFEEFRNRGSSSIFQDVGCSSNKLIAEGFDDVEMDRTLVEKFFEDTAFDDKELEAAVDDNKVKVSSTVTAPSNDQNPVARKIRKSLGGRRSFRCSDKL